MKKVGSCCKTETLCDMVSRKAKLSELKSVVRGARYICEECGRSAADEKRLCAPKSL